MKTNNIFSITLNMTLIILVFFQMNLTISTEALASEEHSLSYENLSVYVMPQYSSPDNWGDQPSVFIGVYGTLKNESDNHINEVSVPIVKTAGEFQLHLVGDTVEEKIASIDAEIDKSNWQISWEPNEAIKANETYDFLVEYYVSIEEQDKKYELSIPYTLERQADLMDVLIFEPFNAENFAVDSNIEKSDSTDQFGIKVHKLEIGEATTGSMFDLNISYEKENRTTTLEAIETLTEQAQQISEANETFQEEQANAEEKSFFTVENTVMLIIALIIIVLLVIFIFQNRRNNKRNLNGG